DLVVHVGHVAHEGDLVAARAEVAREDVERREGAAVTGVREIVSGEAADVDFGHAGGHGLEVLEPLGKCIIQTNGAAGHRIGRYSSPRAKTARPTNSNDGAARD